ncbi:MAG TPA: ABC transporter ATP-binding protein [Gemmatimonadaceae bacterium]
MIVADSISKSFGARRVLSAATLRAPSHKVTGLLGRMGSGKSTLLKICAGLIAPDAGWVEINSSRFHRTRHSLLARKGLFYLADTDNLAWTLSVRDHFSELHRIFDLRVDDEIVTELNIGHLLDRGVSSLSGGETRKVEIAIAMARRPSVLLCDEPFRGADPILCELLGSMFRRLSVDGTAVVVTGHEVNQLMPFLDSVVWITSGTTYHLGTPEAARSHPAFRRDYLGLGEKKASA